MAANILDVRNARAPTAISSKYTDALLKNYPIEGHLKNATFYINADMHDDENVAGGSLAIHDMDAVVHPDSIPASFFEHMIVVPINDHASKPDGYKDSDFLDKVDLLQDAVPQYSDNPPSLAKWDPNRNSDGDVWEPELGHDENAFAGIVKRMRSNQRDADYYIAVKAGAPLASQELKEQLVAEGPITFSKLIKDPRLHYVNAVALRNAKRIAYNVAQKLGLPIHSVSDVSAYAPTTFSALPRRAEPTANRTKARIGYQYTVSSIQPMDYKGEECVGIFHKVRPVGEAIGLNMVVGSPVDGIHVFKMPQKPLGFAIPSDTGRRIPLDDANLEHAETARRHRGVVWDGDHSALKTLGQAVYHPIDDDFYRGMKQMGWKQEGVNAVTSLTPVILKVSNFDHKRE